MYSQEKVLPDPTTIVYSGVSVLSEALVALVSRLNDLGPRPPTRSLLEFSRVGRSDIPWCPTPRTKRLHYLERWYHLLFTCFVCSIYFVHLLSGDSNIQKDAGQLRTTTEKRSESGLLTTYSLAKTHTHIEEACTAENSCCKSDQQHATMKHLAMSPQVTVYSEPL